MAEPCVTAQPATPTTTSGRTSRFLQALRSTWSAAWTATKTFTTHILNTDDPAVDVDVIGFCILLPFSLYWLHTRPHIDGNWAAAFATVWAAVKLSNFRRRPGGDQ